MSYCCLLDKVLSIITYYLPVHLGPNPSHSRDLPCHLKHYEFLYLLLLISCRSVWNALPYVLIFLANPYSPSKALIRHFLVCTTLLTHSPIWIIGLGYIFNNHFTPKLSVFFHVHPKPNKNKLKSENTDLVLKELTGYSGIANVVINSRCVSKLHGNMQKGPLILPLRVWGSYLEEMEFPESSQNS